MTDNDAPANGVDKLYETADGGPVPFRFDERVAQVFPDMINRSVPGYALVTELVGLVTARYARTNTVLYDLGCSLGASTLAMYRSLRSRDCRMVAVDNSPPMIERCRSILQRENLLSEGCGTQTKGLVDCVCADICDLDFEPCSVATMTFTLQFIPIAERDRLLRRIGTAMVSGGALLLSEKLAFADAQEAEIQAQLHHDFKRNRRYSEMEIAGKRAALDHVLVPEPLERHRARLTQAGFSTVSCLFHCFGFCSILALK